MYGSFFERVVVPVANREDAASTARALAPHLEGTGYTVTAIHVIEKAGGAPDKASVEQRQQHAEEIFSIFSEGFDGVDASVETDLCYGTDIAATILETAHERDATTIVFTPRGSNRWQKLLTGDVAHKLLENTDIPVLVLPDREEGEA